MFNENKSGSSSRATNGKGAFRGGSRSAVSGRGERVNGFRNKGVAGYSASGERFTSSPRPSSFSGNRSSGGFSSSARFGSSRFGGRGGNGRGMRDKKFNDISKFINKAPVKVEEEKFVAKNKFTDFNIDERIKQNILEAGYTMPSQIQDESISHIIEGKDLVGIANTGTGKTAAFMIPLINKVLQNKKEMIMILAPTRELAVQIDQEFKKFSKGLKMWSISAVGGLPIYNQIKDFKFDHNFVIGTPGRVKDLMDRNVLNIKEFTTIVLDESDRMLDMGFVDDMKLIMREMPRPHQTLFFSATVSPEVAKIVREFLVDPVSISVKTRDTSSSIDQDVIRIGSKNKIDVLHDLLSTDELEKVIIFGKTKSGVDKLHRSLKDLGHNVESIHGDKRPGERNKALASFKNDYAKILIATDVAARGLDIPNVSHVINYELPQTYEDYIHRIGRTGRGGKTGKALTFVD